MCYYVYLVFADPVTYICMKNTSVANLAVWVASDFALAGMHIIFTARLKSLKQSTCLCNCFTLHTT